MGKGYATKWLPVLVFVILAHAAAWYGLSHLRPDVQPPRPLQVIEVALLAPPPPPEKPKLAPQPPPPPKAEPKIRRKAEPAPRPLLPPQAELAPEAVAVAAPPPPPAPPAQEVPVRSAPEPMLEAPRFNAAYLNNPPPAYPLSARRRGIEGRVMVRAEVQADGSCSRAELKASSGSDLLDQAALEAVKKWRFVPARKGAQAMVAWVEVPISFKLEN